MNSRFDFSGIIFSTEKEKKARDEIKEDDGVGGIDVIRRSNFFSLVIYFSMEYKDENH